MRDARWAAWLGGGEVGTCEEVAGGFAWAVELDPGVVVVRFDDFFLDAGWD